MTSRRTLLGAGLAFASLFAPLSGVVSAAPEERCDAGVLDAACEAAKGAANEVKGAVVGVATAPVRAAAGGAMDSLTRWVADAAVSLIGKVVNLMEETTDPLLSAGWFVERYEFMMGLGLIVLLPLLLCATIRAIMRQDLGQLLRSFFLYLPIAILAAFVAIYLVQALLSVTDGMSAAVSKSVGNDATRFLEGDEGSVKSALVTASGGFLVFFGALLIVIAGFLLWIQLLIRSAGIYVCVFFLPLVLAGLVWPSTSQWARRLIETVVALILSKFVIVSIISLAVAAIGRPSGDGGMTTVSTVIGGSTLLLLAAFSPFALFKLIPIGELAAINHLEGMDRRPGRAVRSGGGWNLQSFIKEKVSQGKSPERAPVSAGVSGAGMATAGAAVAAGATVGAARKAATAPGSGLERQTDAMRARPSRDTGGTTSNRSRRSGDVKHAGGGISAPKEVAHNRPKDSS